MRLLPSLLLLLSTSVICASAASATSIIEIIDKQHSQIERLKVQLAELKAIVDQQAADLRKSREESELLSKGVHDFCDEMSGHVDKRMDLMLADVRTEAVKWSKERETLKLRIAARIEDVKEETLGELAWWKHKLPDYMRNARIAAASASAARPLPGQQQQQQQQSGLARHAVGMAAITGGAYTATYFMCNVVNEWMREHGTTVCPVAA